MIIIYVGYYQEGLFIVHKMSTEKSRLHCLQYRVDKQTLDVYFFIVTIPNNIVALQFSREITKYQYINTFFIFHEIIF